MRAPRFYFFAPAGLLAATARETELQKVPFRVSIFWLFYFKNII